MFDITYAWADAFRAFFHIRVVALVYFAFLIVLAWVILFLQYYNAKGVPVSLSGVLFAVLVAPVIFLVLGLILEEWVVFYAIRLLPIEVPAAGLLVIAYAIYLSQPNVRSRNKKKTEQYVVVISHK